MLRTRAAAATALAAIALAVAGCTQPGPASTTSAGATATPAAPTVAAPSTAAELAEKTQAAIEAATSVAIKGGGEQDGTRTFVDLIGTLDETSYHLLMTQGDATFEIIAVGSDFYLKANEAFFTQIGADPADMQYADKWVTGESVGASNLDMNPTSLLGSLSMGLAADGLSPEVTSGTVDGQDVFIVTNAEGATSGQYSIAADGSWLPVKFTAADVEFTFSQWNQPVTVEAPPSDQVTTIE